MTALMMDELAHRAVEGDRGAFDALVRQYYPRVLGFLRRMVGSDAEDAAQRTFLQAWTAIRSFDPERPIRPWLWAIALNEARKLHRSERPAEPLGEVAADDPLPPSVTEREDTRRRVVELLAELPDEQRSVMILRFQEGFSPAQIAEIEGVSVNAVRIRLCRAVQGLRARLKEES